MDREEYIKLLERVVKSVVNWNRGAKFTTKFLELQDNYDLVITIDGGIIDLKTKFKEVK